MEVNFPPRNDVFEARRVLETKYQQMGRQSASSVDQEGAAIWITEYLRYRTNGCGHAEAEAKVFSQIDGGPPPPTCFVPCSYVLSPNVVNTGANSSTQEFEVRPASGAATCTWTAQHRFILADVCQHALARRRVLAVYLQHRAEQRRRSHRVHRLQLAGRRRAPPGQPDRHAVCGELHDGRSVQVDRGDR